VNYSTLPLKVPWHTIIESHVNIGVVATILILASLVIYAEWLHPKLKTKTKI
jgi:hypothetical protein